MPFALSRVFVVYLYDIGFVVVAVSLIEYYVRL